MENRISMKLKNPNPLFIKWLTKWRDEAIEKDSKMQYCFQKALQSLRKYPIPLESGMDCKILEGFGDKLCKMLDKKLKEHNNNRLNTTVTSGDSDSSKKGRKVAEYVPMYKSGAYAILVTIYKKSLEPNYPGFMNKADIIKQGQHLCDKSFIKPSAGSYYTAWSSMKTLIDKKLIIKQGSPAKYSLTSEGAVLAQKLHENSTTDEKVIGNGSQTINENKITSTFSSSSETDSICSSTTKELVEIEHKSVKVTSSNQSNQCEMDSVYSVTTGVLKKTASSTSFSSKSEIESVSSTSQEETLIFAPLTFNIILIVDTHETVGGTRHPLDDAILAELLNLNVKYEVRPLNVGDYAWICQDITTKKELVLPYIVERKRMDDLGASIKDGRFHEQKFRLKQCGIQNIIYLIESFDGNTHTGLPLPTLYQAATNTLLQDEFSVKFTENIKGTVEYLAALTALLTSIYEAKTLMGSSKQNLTESQIDDDLVPLMIFKEFNKSATKPKNFRTQDIFIRQLLQLRGISVEKAVAIANAYPTPKLLKLKYHSMPSNNGEKLLASLEYGKVHKKVGPVISKTIYRYYSSHKF